MTDFVVLLQQKSALFKGVI